MAQSPLTLPIPRTSSSTLLDITLWLLGDQEVPGRQDLLDLKEWLEKTGCRDRSALKEYLGQKVSPVQ